VLYVGDSRRQDGTLASNEYRLLPGMVCGL
jgi:hypothetical protein